MKKSTLITIANYLKNVPELSAEYAELAAELAKNEEKANANRALYDAAHEVVMSKMTDALITISDLYEKCKDELPEGFSRSKLQYAMSNYWSAEVVKVINPKSANQYRKA